MNLILFGAGASFGSEADGDVPPLGGDLFDALVSFGPRTWGTLSDEWSIRFRGDFEVAMSAFIAKGHFAAPLQWDMAEYFFTQFHATADSAYAHLLKNLRDRISAISFATLNYELLLFQACRHTDIPLNSLSVCLPHGSSILCCEGVRATAGVTFTGGVSTGGTVRTFSDTADFVREKRTNVFPPVMSYYEPNKFTVSCRNYISNERERFSNLVRNAERIVIVGVRVHPIDTHIWTPLAQSPAVIMNVGGEEGADEYTRWSDSQGRSGDIVLRDYFRESLEPSVDFISSS